MPLFAPTFVFQWGCVYPTPLPWKCCSGVRLLDQTSSSLQVFWRLISSLDELGIDFYQQQTSSEEPFCLFNMGQVHLCSHMIKFSSFVSTLALFFLPLSHLTKLNCFLIQHLPALLLPCPRLFDQQICPSLPASSAVSHAHSLYHLSSSTLQRNAALFCPIHWMMAF